MKATPEEWFLERIEKHYFFELERRDRLHASLRLIATMMLPILGASWLLMIQSLPDAASRLAQDLSTASSALAALAALASLVGMVQAGPIATEDYYEVALYDNLVVASTDILHADFGQNSSGPGEEDVRSDALIELLTKAYADAALANLAQNERFTGNRREATYSLMTGAVFVVLAAILRYLAISA